MALRAACSGIENKRIHTVFPTRPSPAVLKRKEHSKGEHSPLAGRPSLGFLWRSITLSLLALSKYAPLRILSTDCATCTTAAAIVHLIGAYCTKRVL